jgi:hypothetical protein
MSRQEISKDVLNTVSNGQTIVYLIHIRPAATERAIGIQTFCGYTNLPRSILLGVCYVQYIVCKQILSLIPFNRKVAEMRLFYNPQYRERGL